MAREPISRRLRFEVFKRDSFRCQYCGATAPDVLLHIDHVKPVADGGTNDLLNLITACVKCNQGKGKRPLSDNSALAKQRDQLAELNERRQQLEMMIQWKEELADARRESTQRVANFWSSLVPGYSLNPNGLQSLKKLIRQYSIDEVMEAMQTATDQYLVLKDGKPTQESVEAAWGKVGGICRVTRMAAKKPYVRDLYYIRGILRNRVYVNEAYVMDLLKMAAEYGADLDEIRDLAAECSNWTEFRESVEAFIDDAQKRQGGRRDG